MTPPMEPTEHGLSALLGRVADAMGRLITQHLSLAKLELAEEAREVGVNLGRLAAFVPFVLVGYAFICAALAALLARWVGMAGALAIVGGLNLVGGTLGVLGALKTLKGKRVLPDTKQELNRSATVLSATADGSLARQDGPHGL